MKFVDRTHARQVVASQIFELVAGQCDDAIVAIRDDVRSTNYCYAVVCPDSVRVVSNRRQYGLSGPWVHIRSSVTTFPVPTGTGNLNRCLDQVAGALIAGIDRVGVIATARYNSELTAHGAACILLGVPMPEPEPEPVEELTDSR